MQSVTDTNAADPCSQNGQTLSETNKLYPNNPDHLHPRGNVAVNWARCSARKISELMTPDSTRSRTEFPSQETPHSNGFRLGLPPRQGRE